MRGLSAALFLATKRRLFSTQSQQKGSSKFILQSALVAVAATTLVSGGILRVAVGSQWRQPRISYDNPARASQSFLVSLAEALVSSAAIDDNEDDDENDFFKSSTTARWILSSTLALDAAGELLSFLQGMRPSTPSSELDDDVVTMTSVFVDILVRQSSRSPGRQSSALAALVCVDPNSWLTLSQIMSITPLANRLEKQFRSLNDVARSALGNGFLIDEGLSAPFSTVHKNKSIFSSFSMQPSTSLASMILRSILRLSGRRPIVPEHDGALALSLLGCTNQQHQPPEQFHALQGIGLAFLSNSTLSAYRARPQILWSSELTRNLQTSGVQLPEIFQNALEAVEAEEISRITSRSSTAAASTLSALDYHFGAITVSTLPMSMQSRKSGELSQSTILDKRKSGELSQSTILDKILLSQCIALATGSCIRLANDKAKSSGPSLERTLRIPSWFAASAAGYAVQSTFISVNGDSSPYVGEAAAAATKLLVEHVCIPLLINRAPDEKVDSSNSPFFMPHWLLPRLQIWLLHAVSRCRGSGKGGLDSQLLCGQSSGPFNSQLLSRRETLESTCALEGVSSSLLLASAALRQSQNISNSDDNIRAIKASLTRPQVCQSSMGGVDSETVDVVRSLCGAALRMRRSCHPTSVVLEGESTLLSTSIDADASIARSFFNTERVPSEAITHRTPPDVAASTQSSFSSETKDGLLGKVGNIFESAIAGVRSAVSSSSSLSSTTTTTTSQSSNNVAFLMMDDDLGPGLGTGINMVMSAEEELNDDSEFGQPSGSLPMTRGASWTALVKRYSNLLDFHRTSKTPDTELPLANSTRVLPTYTSLVDAALMKEESTFPGRDVNSGFRDVRPSLLDLSLAVSREHLNIPRPHKSAMRVLSSLLSAAESRQEEGSRNDSLLELRTSIARSWLVSALYSVANQKHENEFTLPKILRISIARELTRWMPREMDMVAFSSMSAPGTRLVPRAVYRFASWQAERNALTKGSLPPLSSELYIPSSLSSASSALSIHAGKALSYLTSGLTPPDFSAGNDSHREISNSTSKILLQLQVVEPLATLIDAAVKRMQIRHLEIEDASSAYFIEAGVASRNLSEAVEVDRIYKDNVALARQCVRLLANVSMKLNEVKREDLRNQLLSRAYTPAALTAMLHSHDAKLSSHTWRLVANLGGILNQTDSERNWKYGDMLFPVYQTDASRVHPSDQGIDLVLVHGLQGVALKTWRSGGKSEKIQNAVALGPMAVHSTPSESAIFARRLLSCPPKNLDMHVAVVPEGKDATSSHPGNSKALTGDGGGREASINSTTPKIISAVKPSKSWKRLGLWPVTWLARDIERGGVDFNNAPLSSDKAKFNVRVISLTYDAEIWGQDGVRPAVNHTSTAAEASHQLEAAGVGSNGRRVVFLSHSMGGLLTERILLYRSRLMNQSSDVVDGNNEIDLLSPLAKAASAVIFLATPHSGAPVAEFAVQQLARMHRVLPATKALAYPSHHVDVLANDGDVERALLNDAFKVLVNRKKGDLHVLSLAEGKPADLAQAADGVLGAIPLGILIVPPSNAACGVGDFHVLEHEDHVSISKPQCREKGCYPLVTKAILKSCSTD